MHMDHTRFKWTRSIAAAVLAGATLSACAQARANNTDEDTPVGSDQRDGYASATIAPGQNEIGKAFVKALIANDVDAIVALYEDDAVYHALDTLELKGTADIRANFAGFLGAFTVMDAAPSEVHHFTRGDLSFSWGKLDITLAPKAGGEPFKFEVRFSEVSKLINGKWMYISDHVSVPTKDQNGSS